MYLDYQGANQRVHSDLKFYAGMILPPLTESIWNFNDEAIQTVIQGITKSPSLIGVTVLDQRGHAWNAGYAVNSEDPEHLEYFDTRTGVLQKNNLINSSSVFNYTQDIYFHEEGEASILIGQVILYSSSRIVFNQVKNAIIVILVNAGLKIIVLWALFLIYGFKLLTKPLQALTKATQSVRQGNLQIPSLPTESKWPTEIEILNDNFNAMTNDLEISQKRLIEAQARTRAIIDSMPSMIIGLNKELKITDWNKKIQEFNGVEIEQALQKDFMELVPEYQFVRPMLEKAIRERTTEFSSKQSIYHDNKRYYQDILVYPIALNGEIGAVVRIDDVTGKMQLEKVIVQTEKLSSVGTLASGMAHQMNGPVGAISQNIQNIHRRIDPNLQANKEIATELSLDLHVLHQYLEKRKITSFLGQMEQSAQDVSIMLTNLMQFSKPSSSIKESVSLEKILSHVLTLAKSDYDLSKKMHFEQINIDVCMEEELPAVYGSVAQLEQVFLNLIKFSAQNMQYQDSDRKIRIQSQVCEDSVEIKIIDNGPILDENTKKHIFDPLFTQQKDGESILMGLSVAHKMITENHLGALVVENNEPIGIIFTILLPKAREADSK
jgi:PAS domain S-box-containing protein